MCLLLRSRSGGPGENLWLSVRGGRIRKIVFSSDGHKLGNPQAGRERSREATPGKGLTVYDQASAKKDGGHWVTLPSIPGKNSRPAIEGKANTPFSGVLSTCPGLVEATLEKE